LSKRGEVYRVSSYPTREVHRREGRFTLECWDRTEELEAEVERWKKRDGRGSGGILEGEKAWVRQGGGRYEAEVVSV